MALTDNIVSYYKLEENAANTTVVDELGTNAGTASTNTSNLSVTGRINNGFDFVKTTPEFVTISDSASLDITGDMTVNIWMKFDINNGTLIVKGDIGVPRSGWRLVISGNSKIIWIVEQSDGADSRADSTTVLSSGTWYMITGVYHAGTDVEIFVNGVSADIDTLNIEASQLANNVALLIADDVSSIIPYDGVLDEVGIWSRALSGTELLEIYNSGNGLSYPFGGAGNVPMFVSNF